MRPQTMYGRKAAGNKIPVLRGLGEMA